jgi:hypothetical protein
LFGTVLALSIVWAAACGDDSSKKADAGLDGSTDTDSDSDTDSDTDTDTDTDSDSDTDTDSDFDTELDLDCSNPVPGPGEDDDCALGTDDCDTGFVCSEHAWVGDEMQDSIIGNYCYPECEVLSDGGVEDGGMPETECEGSATTCIGFDEELSYLGCVPQGQFKAAWAVNIVPDGVEPGQFDLHECPIGESWNCQEAGFADMYGAEFLDPEGDMIVIGSQVLSPTPLTDLWVRMLQVTIPAESFAADTVLNTEDDPEAFGAAVIWARLQSLMNPTIIEARFEALLTEGEIYIAETADPCAGAGCDLASGTMDLTFAMIFADADPAAFNE